MGDPLDPSTWEGLVGGLGLAERTIAHRVLSGRPAPDWGVQPAEFRNLVAPHTTASQKALLIRSSLAEETTYSLGLVAGNVLVLHALAETYELKADGGRYVAFGGDIRVIAGQSKHPDLWNIVAATSRGAMSNHFITRAVPVQEWEAIAVELAAEEEPDLVDGAVATEVGEDPPLVHIQLTLPVPAMIAALFLKPISARTAFMRGQILREIIPEAHRNNYDPLFDFLRGAVTRHADHDRPSIEAPWEKLVIGPDTPMEVRYFRMISKLLPEVTPPGAPVPPNIPPPEQPDETGGGGKAEPEKYKYHDFQCRLIWSASGKQPDTFAVQTEASMPDFFQGLKEHRGSNAQARQYIESAWKGHKSTERMPTPFVWSTQLVKDIRNLDFGASDIAHRYDMRGRGLSYYALGPTELFVSGNYVRTADEWRMFEQSEVDGNLTLQERKDNQKGGLLISGIPTDRMHMICHLEGVAARYQFLFQEQCPVVVYLRWYAQKISQDTSIATWDKNHWKVFNWQVHVALRKVWNDCNDGIGKEQLAYLSRIQSDLSMGRRFSIEECPPELRTKKRDQVTAGLGSGTRVTDPDPGQDKKKAKATATAKSPMADNFATTMKNAKAATKNKAKFHLGKILTTPADYEYVMGPDMKALQDGGKNPCGRFYICGCNTRRCTFSHTLTADPSKNVIDGMVRRLKEKADAYAASEAAKE